MEYDNKPTDLVAALEQINATLRRISYKIEDQTAAIYRTNSLTVVEKKAND